MAIVEELGSVSSAEGRKGSSFDGSDRDHDNDDDHGIERIGIIKGGKEFRENSWKTDEMKESHRSQADEEAEKEFNPLHSSSSPSSFPFPPSPLSTPDLLPQDSIRKRERIQKRSSKDENRKFSLPAGTSIGSSSSRIHTLKEEEFELRLGEQIEDSSDPNSLSLSSRQEHHSLIPTIIVEDEDDEDDTAYHLTYSSGERCDGNDISDMAITSHSDIEVITADKAGSFVPIDDKGRKNKRTQGQDVVKRERETAISFVQTNFCDPSSSSSASFFSSPASLPYSTLDTTFQDVVIDEQVSITGTLEPGSWKTSSESSILNTFPSSSSSSLLTASISSSCSRNRLIPGSRLGKENFSSIPSSCFIYIDFR